MISAVLDTNVLASGTVVAVTPPGQILNAWRANEFELVLSAHIIGELTRTLQKPYFQKHVTSNEVAYFIDLLENEATITPLTVNIHGVAPHLEDDLVLATAVSAKVNYLVTGDKPLLEKVGRSYNKINLVTPADFLQILKQKG